MQRLSAQDIKTAAEISRVNPVALRAVIAVESAGDGYLPNGWLKILFERHHFWKRLQSRGIWPGPIGAARPDLCGPTWDRKHYLGGVKEWDRISGVVSWAQRNDPSHWESYKKAAYEACSFGLLQFMGGQYQEADYPDVYSLKHSFEESERNQLLAVCRWMEKNGTMDSLRREDWKAFARRYNGPGQVLIYSARLWVAFKRSGG